MYVHWICIWCPQRPDGEAGSLRTGIETVVSLSVVVGNWIWILYASNKCSWSLSHLAVLVLVNLVYLSSSFLPSLATTHLILQACQSKFNPWKRQPEKEKRQENLDNFLGLRDSQASEAYTFRKPYWCIQAGLRHTKTNLDSSLGQHSHKVHRLSLKAYLVTHFACELSKS